MRRGNKILVWYLMMSLGCAALAAQESGPESKSGAAPQQATGPAPQRIRVSQGVSQALIVRKVQPAYPPKARESRIQGEVALKVLISREGDVSEVSLISGHPLLAPAAIDAVKLWKYKPYLLNGRPIQVETQVVVNFRLESDSAGDAPPPDLPPPAEGGVVGEVPGGQTKGVIGGIISSTPSMMPRVATPQRVRASSGLSSGLLVKKVNPEYPEEARRGRIQGTVVLHALISKAGDIETLEVVSGDPALAPEAIRAVKQWKYKPYLLNGNPVEVDTQILVNFTLSGN